MLGRLKRISRSRLRYATIICSRLLRESLFFFFFFFNNKSYLKRSIRHARGGDSPRAGHSVVFNDATP